MDTGLLALLIVLAVIIFSVATRKCMECLIAGSIVAALISFGGGFLSGWCTQLLTTFADNAWLLLVCGLFGSLIAILEESKGTLGFQRIIKRLCNTERKTLLTTLVLGILVFVDDYLNVMSVGVCMKGAYDDRKLPRESLAYMLDATGAPVCVLIPFSTWSAFYASLFISQDSVVAAGFDNGFSAYVSALPYFFYPIICLLIVLLFSLGIMPKLGGMKKAYKRVEETGKLYSDASRKFNQQKESGYEGDGNLWDFLIPMAVLIAVSIATSDVLVAAIASLLVCFILFVPRRVIRLGDFMNIVVRGYGDMLPILSLLVVGFGLGSMLDNMGLADFVIRIAQPYLVGNIFPLITFIVVSALTFTTGNLWGMCAVVAPIVFPLGAAVDANVVLIMAAIVSGGAFGSHACFYTDCTLLSSMSAGIDNIEHAVSQLPYVVIGAVASAVCFLAAGFIL